MSEETRLRQGLYPLAEYPPKIVLLPSSSEVDGYAAERFNQQVRTKYDSVLVVPTGFTPRGMYEILVKSHRYEDYDYSGLTIFNLDEYWPISRDHPSSYTRYMEDRFYNYVNVRGSQRFIPNGEAPDPQEEARRYEELLQRYAPVDLAIIGIGPGKTAHIGFNEPGSLESSRVRCVELNPETYSTNSTTFVAIID